MARMIPQRLITDASHWQTGDVRVVFDIESDFLVPWFPKAKLLWKYNADTEKGTYHEGTAQWTCIKWAQLCNQPRGRNRTGPVPTAPCGHSARSCSLDLMLMESCGCILLTIQHSKIWKNPHWNLATLHPQFPMAAVAGSEWQLPFYVVHMLCNRSQVSPLPSRVHLTCFPLLAPVGIQYFPIIAQFSPRCWHL